MKTNKNNVKKIAVTVLILLIINIVGHFVFKRFDLTADKRYTLSEASLNIVASVKEPVYLEVYLEGNFPGEFKKLQTETQQLLEEFKAENSNIVFQFINPLENEKTKDEKLQQLLNKGLTPVNVTVNDKGQQTQEIVFPWAMATCGSKSVKVPLLKNMMGASTAEKVVSSVQHLEYAFANALNTVSKNKERKVAVIKGNGELEDIFIADFIKSVRDNYYIGTFTLDSVAANPVKSAAYLKKYDLIVVAKPTQVFTDQEKQVLDQFVVHGGKSLWLIDQINMETDSLMRTGENLAFPRDLNLNDMFFKYGIRMRPELIKDLMATPIALATGEQGSATQYTQFPWFYSPLIYPSDTQKNPIVSNLDGMKFEYAGPIEPLKNNLNKTILLQSSPYSKLVGLPSMINLNMVDERPEQKDFMGGGSYPVAVLIEGKFTSVFQNRVLAFKDATFKNTDKLSKMIVVSDGDVIKNQIDKNFQPLELGYDKWTNNLYGNKEFMLNCVNYLLDENGLINIRSKEVDLPLLDKEKVAKNYTSSQFITVGMPLVLLALFGLLFTFIRRKRYSR
jgi:gliding-associated putative ABC transporter substrate-binding component GldG